MAVTDKILNILYDRHGCSGYIDLALQSPGVGSVYLTAMYKQSPLLLQPEPKLL